MKINYLGKNRLSLVIALSAASVAFAQTVKDSTKSKDIEQVVLTGVADIAKDRKTPVAVSTIKEAQIVERLGNQEFQKFLQLHLLFIRRKVVVVSGMEELTFVVLPMKTLQ